MTRTSKPAASHRPGNCPGQKPYHSFWGDIDDDGKETKWDDVLGDGLLGDVLLAQDRANRGLPPEPEDEMLIGRRRASQSLRPANSADAAWVVVAVMSAVTVTACLCYMTAMGLG